MFDLSIEKIAVLGMLALFILGPERLPAAMSWLGRAVRQAKDYAAQARAQLESPEFAELREPLEEFREPLAQLRTLRDPRTALTRHLLEQPGQPPTPATPTTTTASSPEPTTDPPNPGTPNPGTPNPGTPNPGSPNPGTPNAGSPNPAAGSAMAGAGGPPPIDADAT